MGTTKIKHPKNRPMPKKQDEDTNVSVSISFRESALPENICDRVSDLMCRVDEVEDALERSEAGSVTYLPELVEGTCAFTLEFDFSHFENKDDDLLSYITSLLEAFDSLAVDCEEEDLNFHMSVLYNGSEYIGCDNH